MAAESGNGAADAVTLRVRRRFLASLAAAAAAPLLPDVARGAHADADDARDADLRKRMAKDMASL